LIPIAELKKFPLFADLDPADLSLLANIGEYVHAAEGDVLFQAGGPARTLYVLEEGNVMVAFPDGRAITLHGPGKVVGWSALVAPDQYRASIICLTDCSFIAFPGSELLRLVQRNAAMGTKIMRRLSEGIAKRLPFIPEAEKRRLKLGR